jgi:hypothetical protein
MAPSCESLTSDQVMKDVRAYRSQRGHRFARACCERLTRIGSMSRRIVAAFNEATSTRARGVTDHLAEDSAFIILFFAQIDSVRSA